MTYTTYDLEDFGDMWLGPSLKGLAESIAVGGLIAYGCGGSLVAYLLLIPFAILGFAILGSQEDTVRYLTGLFSLVQFFLFHWMLGWIVSGLILGFIPAILLFSCNARQRICCQEHILLCGNVIVPISDVQSMKVGSTLFTRTVLVKIDGEAIRLDSLRGFGALEDAWTK